MNGRQCLTAALLKETGHKPVSGRPLDASTSEGRVRTGGCERTRLRAGGRVPVRFERTGGCIEGPEPEAIPATCE